METRPVICKDCAALYVQEESGQSCPVCLDPPPHPVRIREDDPRYLIMVGLTLRYDQQKDGRFSNPRQLKATQREQQMLEHGDEIILDSSRWRIAAKSLGDLWLARSTARRSPSKLEIESKSPFVDRIPDRIPLHVLECLPSQVAKNACVLPISRTRFPGPNGRHEVVALSGGVMESEVDVSWTASQMDWIFWQTDRSLIDAALDVHYARRDLAIENCGSTFEYECPRRWEELAPTDVADVRYCEGCQERVYLATDRDQAWYLSESRHCIAFELESEMTMGIMAPLE